MKKKLLTIFVVVILCLSIMSLCFVGCKKDNNGGNQQQQQGGGEQGGQGGQGGEQGGQGGEQQPSDPSAADLEQLDYLASYAGAWAINNAEKNPSASDLQKGLNAVKSKWSNVKKITVAEENGNFKISVSFKDNTSKDVSVKKVVLDANRFVAGIPYAATNTLTKFDDVFVPVYNGLMKTIKTAIDNGVAFAEDEEGNAIFSASAELDLALFVGHIGDLFGGFEAPFEYGLRIQGNVGREAKDTQVALEILQAKEPIIGLYYIGAEAKADCKLYLGIDIGEYHATHFIDNADLNALVIGLIESMMGGEDEVIDEFDENVEAGEEEEELPFYEKEIEGLSDFLSMLGLDATVGQLVNSVIGSVLKDNMGFYAIEGGKMYQIRIKVGALLDQVLGIDMVGTIVTNLVSNIDLLKDLDTATMQGIGGDLILSVAVMDDGTLGGLELSYNVDERDFRFNASDTVAKKYGPINLALSIKDFSLGEQEVAIGIGEEEDYTYFSPFNFDGEADYTASIALSEDNESTVKYTARLQSDINPFDIENGEFLLTVDVVESNDEAIQVGRLFSLYGDLFWNEQAEGFGLDAELEIFYNGEIAYTTVSDVMFPIVMYGMAAVMTPESVCGPVVELVMDLMAQFGIELPMDLGPDEDETLRAADEEEEEDDGLGIDAMGLVNVISHLGDLLNSLKEEGFLDFPSEEEFSFDYIKNLDWSNPGEALAQAWEYILDNGYIKADLDYRAYNEVIEYLSEGIGALEDLELDNTAAVVKVFANYGEEYHGRIFVNVVYKGVEVNVDISIKDWESDSVAYVQVDIIKTGEPTVTYLAKLDASGWDDPATGAIITYDVIKGADATRYVELRIMQIISANDDEEAKCIGYDCLLDICTDDPSAQDGLKHHTFRVSVYNDDGLYVFQGEAKDHLVCAYFGQFTYESAGTTSFGIPKPLCTFIAGYSLDDRDFDLTVERAEMLSWGEAVEIEYDTPEEANVIGDDEDESISQWILSIIDSYLQPFINVEWGQEVDLNELQ